MMVNTDLFPTNYDKDLLKRRQPWYWLALLLFVISLFSRQPLLFLAALFTFLVAIVPDLWYRNALRHLVIRQYVNHRNVFFGEEVTLSVSIENHKFLPLPWLKVPRQYRMRCQERVFHIFGRVSFRSSDPFGWLDCEGPVPAVESLVVYP